MLDLLIRNGTVVDGTGRPARHADVGVRDGRIVALGNVAEHATRTIDADGLVVAPGFVDIHTHYDAQLFWDPFATPSSLHGVTTIVGGNCGFTLAPLRPQHATYIMEMMARVEGMSLPALASGLPWDWGSFGDWLDRLDGRVAVNSGFLVGHSALRRYVMGERSVGSSAGADEVDAMTRALGDALHAGALGLSSSQAPTHNDGDGNPVPSRFATDDEMLALARVVGAHAGTTLEMIPSGGLLFSDADVELMAGMSRVADRPLNWNVLTVESATSDTHVHKLAASDRAAALGGRVVGLVFPARQRFRLSLLTGFVFEALPGWADTMHLPPAERIEALRDPEVRRQLAAGAASSEVGNLNRLVRFHLYEVGETFSAANRGLEGRRIGELATERDQQPLDVLFDIALADDLRTGLMPPPNSDDDDATWRRRAAAWRDPRTVVGGSDAGAHLDMMCGAIYPTAMLSNAVRDRGLLGIEEAVHLMTDQPARFYGLRGRGRIAEGWCADMVVFDPDTVGHGPLRSRFDLPSGAERLFSDAVGIEHVIVNGTEIVSRGELTGARPGTLLRSGRDTVSVPVASFESGSPATAMEETPR